MINRENKESIREWYERTTWRTRKIITWTSFLAVVGGTIFFWKIDFKTAAFMQTANGAITIPVAGAIWIAAFIWIFLIPSREVGFRSQESLEKTTQIIQSTIEEKLGPAMEVWKRLGERVQAEFDKGLLDDLKNAVKDLREAAAKVHEGNGEVKKFAADVKPVIKALQELQDKMKKDNILYEIVEGARAIRALGGQPLPPPPPLKVNGKVDVQEQVPEIDEPKVGKALDLIRKKQP